MQQRTCSWKSIRTSHVVVQEPITDEAGSCFPNPLKCYALPVPVRKEEEHLPFPAGVQQDQVQGRLLLLHLLKDPLHADAVLRGVQLWSINRDHVVPPQMFIPMPSIVEYSWEHGEEKMSHDASLQVCSQLSTAISYLLPCRGTGLGHLH